MGLMLCITIAVIVYGSLYPFDFHAPITHRTLWETLNTWPSGVDRFTVRDVAINIFIYLPVGLFGSLWMKDHKLRRVAGISALSCGLLVSLSMEILQYFDDSRSPSFMDVTTNGIGTALGVLAARFYGEATGRAVSRGRRLGDTGALVLLLAWFGYQLFPFFPRITSSALHAGVTALRQFWPIALVPAIGAVIDWLAVARLIEAVAGTDNRWLLPATMALLPARAFVLGRSTNVTDIAGALAAACIWMGWLRGFEKRTVLIAWLAAAMLVARGLAPYHWHSPPVAFCWVPFASLLESDWSSAGMVFFHKSFLYGTAVWLFVKAGYSYAASTIGLAIVLGTIEAVQVHLPGRSPEITDPLLLILLAIVLKSTSSLTRPAGRHNSWRNKSSILPT